MADLLDRMPVLRTDEQNAKPPKHFMVDARTILQLGRQSIKDNVTAVLELVKNSYDADADVVEVEVITGQENSYIRIADDGCGMTEKEVDDNWLRIGFSGKRMDRYSSRNRRKTGEKGVGRISADRLGSSLELRTRAAGQNEFGLIINWNDFEVEGENLSDVPLQTLEHVDLDLPTPDEIPATSGTELKICGLRELWTATDIQTLYEELSVLTPPFEQVQDFKIYLKTDVETDYKGLVTSSFQEAALLEMDARFDGEILHYCLIDRSNSAAPVTLNAEIEWKQLVQRVSHGKQIRTFALTGPVRLKLLFYLRSQTDLLSEAGLKLEDLREFLDRNVGVKIYRDNIRVRPYGDPATPDGDWLGLNARRVRNPAGLDRPDYTFSANQVVGAVFLSRDDNSELIDSASREGLIHGEAFADMRALTLASLALMEIHRHEENQKQGEKRDQPSADKMLTDFAKELSTLKKDLEEVQDNLANALFVPTDEIKRTLNRVSRVAENAQATAASLNEIMSQSGVLRGLATLGIAASVFGHETQSALSQFISSTALVRDLLQVSPPDTTSTLDEVEKALRYARQVSAWGAFSLARVKRNKRNKRNLNVKETICQITKGLESVFQSASIRLDTTRLEDVNANLFEMDIEAIVLNLLTNAYIACQQMKRPRVVQIELSKIAFKEKEGCEIVVSDTGPGVADDLVDKIWKPLVSFRKDAKGNEEGTGLGLTIVSSIITEAGGHKSVSRSEELGGARFAVWLPME